MTLRGVGPILGLVLLASVSCERAPEATTTSDATDFVMSEEGDQVFAVLSDEPELSLGGASAAGPTQFFQIQGLQVDYLGRLWILDGRSRELRVFSPEGRHDTTLGGPGEGPGEFERPRLLGVTDADEVLVGDARTARISLFGPELEFRESWSLLGGDDAPPVGVLALSDGSVVAQLPRVLNAGALTAGQMLADTARLVRVTPGVEEARTLLVATGMRWIWTGRQQVPVPFTAPPAFAPRDDRVLVAQGSQYRIEEYAGDSLIASFGVERPRRTVTSADVAEYRAFVEESVPDPGQAEFLAALDGPARPDTLPAYRALLIDVDGRVWAQRFAVDAFARSEWDVFDRAGLWQGRVEMPAGFRALQVLEGAVVGVWYDELGVEFVRRYSWHRPV